MACGSATRSAILQETDNSCYGLGASATRTIVAAATGVTLSFSGGDDGRSSILTIECSDVMRPLVTSVMEVAPKSYTATVLARAGCAIQCGRNITTGAVCSGETHGACVVDGADSRARCVCTKGHSGPACENSDLVGRHPQKAALQIVGVGVSSFDELLFPVLLLILGTSNAAFMQIRGSASTSIIA